MEVERDESPPRETRTRSSRKRTTPPMQYQEEEVDLMNQLAPAATALKRRRLAEQTERRRRGEVTPPVETIKESPEPEIQPPKKVKPEIDVLGVARSNREKAEELARKEREALQEALSGMDIDAIRNLAIIEDMEITRQPPPQRATREDESDRWDDKWNGRKNFKKFRRRGETDNRARDFHRVIVPLEEVKKRDFGIGDDYWLEDDNQRRKKKDKGRETQDAFPVSQPRPKTGSSTRAAEIMAEEEEEEEQVPTRRSASRRSADADDLLSSDPEVVEKPPEPAVTSRSQRSQTARASTSQKPAAATRKRAAATSLSKPAPAKKARQAVTRRKDDSDDSDDGLKFRFSK